MGILCTVPVLQEIYLYTLQRMRCQEFFSLSGKEIHVTNECMRHALNRSPTCSKTVSPQITASTHNGGEGEDVKVYGTENIAAKAAGHLSQDFRWQAAMRQRGLLRGGYIIFWLGDRIAKFKVDQN